MEDVIGFETFKNSYFIGDKTITNEMLVFCKQTNKSSKSYKIARFIDDFSKIIANNAREINEDNLQKRIMELM